MRINKIIVLTIILFGSCAFAQQDFSKVEIKTIEVNKNIYMLMGSGGNLGLSTGTNGTPNFEVPPASLHALPVVTFPQSLTFHWNEETIEIIHFPKAHTDGDSAIFFKNANVIHTGDLFFNGIYPFIDAESGGSIMGMIKSVEEIVASKPTADFDPKWGKGFLNPDTWVMIVCSVIE